MNGYDIQYIGRLANLQDLHDTQNIVFKDKDYVFINNEDRIQYVVKSLTEPALSNDLFSGYMSSFDHEYQDGLEDDPYKEKSERKSSFEEQVGNRMIIFTYKVKNIGNKSFFNINKARLVGKPTGITSPDTKFIAIPMFCSANDEYCRGWERETGRRLLRDYLTYDEFIDKIRNNKSIGKVGCYEISSNSPSFVVWREENGSLIAVGEINSYKTDSLGAIVLGAQNAHSIDLNDYKNFCVYDQYTNPTIMFISQDIYDEISNRLLQESISLNEKKLENRRFENGRIAEPKATDIITTTSQQTLVHISTDEKKDELILNYMKYHSQKMDLYYDAEDLINFHTAVKSGNLVILSGLSGTGKSALVDVYSTALGIKDNMLFIPVRPSWNDDSDLLGYVDLVHMVYRASDNGFVDFLVDAAKDENQNSLYLVCFDEMNLARVEHYFSQFLSLLEKKPGQRKLRLYDEQYANGRLYNAGDYPSTIMIGDNIKFIGTVNIDESTYHFSDKVLDRANVISLKILNYSDDWKSENYETVSSLKWSAKEYNDLVATSEPDKKLREFLWDMHVLMQQTSVKLGIGARVVKGMEKYLSNLPKGEAFKLERAKGIDYQVVQRVLTKIRGPENQLGNLLNGTSEDSLLKLFNKYETVSSFEQCRLIVNEKKKELDIYGYCV